MVFKQQTFHEEEPTVELEHPPRAAMETMVAEALAVAGGLDATEVTVTASAGTVTLAGSVLRASEIDRASEVARSVYGVEQVVNKIRSAQSA
jgi:osmotically-inducible protein OsmY